MKTITAHPRDIEVGERHRALSEPDVDRIAKSMEAIGLRQPITVRIVDDVMIDGKPCDGVPILVAGRHRLAAAVKLGWTAIDCIEVDDNEIDAELWEISENLHRLDLTKEQRDEHIRRYAELLGARREVSRQNGAKPQSTPLGGRPKGVAREVAEETGVSVRTVQRALNPPSADPPKEVFDVHEQARRRLMSAWNGATEEDRQWFRDWIETPVMDVRYG